MFTKYNSLTNHTDKKFLNKLMFAGLTDPSVTWIAREKIHGANFSFLVTADKIDVAKRSGVIPDSENFFNHDEVVIKYRHAIREVFDRILRNASLYDSDDFGINPEMTVQIYGELAGRAKSGKQVQSEVDYGELEFFVFDIKVNERFLSETEMVMSVSPTKLLLAPMIKLGSFDELIGMRNDFDSFAERWKNDFNATAWDKMEHIQFTGKNTAEGFVMKPLKTHFIGETRVAIKSKNEGFSEKKTKVKNFVPPVPMTEKDQEVLAELLTYNTENRIKNVLSKTGPVNVKQFGMVMGLTVKDILEESENILDTAENPSIVKKQLVNDVSTLIRKNWINIMNGEF